MARAACRLVALLLLLAAFAIVDATENHKPWSSCYSYHCITSWEKEGF